MQELFCLFNNQMSELILADWTDKVDVGLTIVADIAIAETHDPGEGGTAGIGC